MSVAAARASSGTKALVLFAAVVLLAAVAAAPSGAIHDGSDADIAEFPWMAALHRSSVPLVAHPEKLSESGLPVALEYVCGAVPVAERLVLIAGHCAVDYFRGRARVVSPLELAVTIGVDKQPDGQWPLSEYRRVTHVELYENVWTDEAASSDMKIAFDIALLRLDTPIDAASQIKVADMSLRSAAMFGDAPMTLALGWGSTAKQDIHTSGSVPDRLQRVPQTLREDSECWPPADVDHRVAMTHVCTKAPRHGFAWRKVGGPRVGDSGGPLAGLVNDEWLLFGILTHGPVADDPNYSGAIEVVLFRDWIARTIARVDGT